MRSVHSPIYTEQLRGKTIESVEHQHYGPIRINFTDGTYASLEPSGSPATIFINLASQVDPLVQRVFTIGA
jgi:hypothetical protein